MDDLISRQAAIDAILAVTGNSSVRELYEHVQEHGLSDMWSGGVNAAIDIIIAVPSAQSEKSTTAEKSQLAEEKSTRKLIYLDDAIRIVESFYKVNADIRRIMAFELRQLPSAQPKIIRCKDCKYACIDPERESDEIYCSENDFWKDDDFYCGYAERRTEE